MTSNEQLSVYPFGKKTLFLLPKNFRTIILHHLAVSTFTLTKNCNCFIIVAPVISISSKAFKKIDR